MAKKRLQIFASSESFEYIQQIEKQRRNQQEDNQSISSIAAELLELGCKMHQFQNQKQSEEKTEIDLPLFLKDLAEYVISASTFAKGAYVVADQQARNESPSVTSTELNRAIKNRLHSLMEKHHMESTVEEE